MLLSDDEEPPYLIERISGRGGLKGGGSNDTETGEEAPNTLKSKQVARVIDLLSEGPIQGVVGGAKGVYFDGVVVRRPDGTYNFKNANIQFVNGYPTQAVMSGFPAEEAEEGVGLEMKKGFPLTRSIINTDVDRCRVTVSVPSLQKIDKETGNIYGAEVQFRVEVSNNGGGFAKVGDYTITGKTTSPYQRSYTFPLLRPGPWDIRLQRLTADSTTLDIQDSINWDSFTAIIDDKVNYSNSACVGTIIDAEQFRSIPKRVYDVEGLLIRYPTNMDPERGEYTGAWDGNFAFGWCNNPAWVLYDLIVNGRYGIGDYIPATMVDKWSFYKAGVFCDLRVPSKVGGSNERRYTCNVRITNRQEAFDLLTQMASIFRGFSYWSGGQLTLVADQPENPIDLYTNANVIDGVFSYSGTDRRERHTQVLVAWQDPDQLGETRFVSVEETTAIARYGLLQAQEAAFGCTRESQALRAGKWTLYTEQYEDDSIVFETGLQGAYLRPGSIIKVADANIGGLRRGGRVGNGSTYNHIVLDARLPFIAGTTYYLNCVIVTDEDTASVQSRAFAVPANGSYDEIDIASGFSAPPLPDQPFVITEAGLEATLWRVMMVKQTEREQYQVNGVRHYPQKWDYVEKNLAFSEPDITNIVAKPSAVTNAKVFEYIEQTSAISLQVMATFSWTSRSPLFDVFYHRTNENWIHIRTDQHAVSVPIRAGSYVFQVTPIGTIGIKGPMTEVKATFVGLTAPPKGPQNFRVTVIEGVALFSWKPATEIDMIVGGHFELRFTTSTSGSTWNNAQAVLPSIPGSASSVETSYQVGTWMLRAFDIESRASSTWATIITLAPDGRYTGYYRICEDPYFPGVHVGTQVVQPQRWLTIRGMGGLWDSQLSDMSTWTDVDFLPVPEGEVPLPPEGIYYFQQQLDAGAPFRIRLAADVLAFPYYPDATKIDERSGKVDSWPDWDDLEGDLNGACTILVRTTLHDPASAAAVWDTWKVFIGGEYYARGFQFAAHLTAAVGQNIGVETLCITGDFRNKADAGEDVPYAAAVKRVNFNIKFFALPSIVVTVQQAQSTDNIQIIAKTTQYFDISITTTPGGAHVTRTFDWHAAGF